MINIQEVGQYAITIYATDQSGNISMLDTYVKVVDTTPPTIRLVSNPQPIEVFDEDALTKLDQYIIDIYDGDTLLSINQASITHDIQIDRLGTYSISYSVADIYGNLARYSLEVVVVDETQPTITLIEPLILPVYGPEIFFNQYFEILDNYDEKAALIIDIDASPKYSETGRYPIVVTAKDSSKNIAKYEGYIEIIDDISPTIIQISDIVITDFQPHVLISFFNMSDNYDEIELLTMNIDDTLVNYNEIGIYPITVDVTDQSLNQTYLETELFILDVTSPTLSLLQNSLTLAVNESTINLRSMINVATDNYDFLTTEDVIIETNLDVNVVGMYDIYYVLTDTSGNQTTCILKIIIDDFTPPVIELSHLTINQYDTIDLYENVYAYDDVSIPMIKCFPEMIDTSQPGDYTLTYIAQDARGNYTMKERLITILASPTHYDINDFIPIISIVIMGSMILYTIKKRG